MMGYEFQVNRNALQSTHPLFDFLRHEPDEYLEQGIESSRWVNEMHSLLSDRVRILDGSCHFPAI